MKKKRFQNIVLAVVAIGIIGAIAAYSYTADQTKQKGLQFGIELEQIQDDIKEIQTRFYSEKTRWEEGDITQVELFAFYDQHLEQFRNTIARYDMLDTPELFQSSVDLLRLSSEAQLDSDSQFVKWIKTGDESARTRSDTQIQESLEYEMLGLVEFYSAKTGIRNYDDDLEKFTPPPTDLRHKVIAVYEDMKSKCDDEFGNESGGLDDKVGWSSCIDDAKKWKMEHLP